jgi:hypothetical protein
VQKQTKHIHFLSALEAKPAVPNFCLHHASIAHTPRLEWTLNQGDGTISRTDIKTARNLANIEAGIPGGGGEIAFGFHSAWATLIGFPITRVDATTNEVIEQWADSGGDSIRVAHGSLWLANYESGEVWRITPAQ